MVGMVTVTPSKKVDSEDGVVVEGDTMAIDAAEEGSLPITTTIETPLKENSIDINLGAIVTQLEEGG